MIEEQGKYYLYRHIRPDKNEPFYIGIGTKVSIGNVYSRAYTKCKRTKIWNDIVNKNNGQYEIEIILESNDYVFIQNKEKEFIALYGRKDLGAGILANLTDGGEGCVGVKMSDETKQKLSTKALGRKWDDKRKEEFKKYVHLFSHKGLKRSAKTCKRISERRKQDIAEGKYTNPIKRGSQNKSATVNEEQVLIIKDRIEQGFLYKDIALEFNIKTNAVSAIAIGRTWRHITGFSKGRRRRLIGIK